jgi:hypothetical protein
MYTETTATSVEDLLDQIAIAAAAEGWTVDRNALVGSLRTVTLHKSGDYIHLWNTAVDHFFMRGSTGYDGLETPDNQPGMSETRAQCNCYDGPFGEVFFFADDSPAEHFHVVINIDGIRYRHATFGMLDKFGAYTGGTYFDAIHWDDADGTANGNPLDLDHHQLFSCSSAANTNIGAVRCDLDGETDYFAGFANPGELTGPNATGGFGSENAGEGGSYGDGFRTKSAFYDRSINTWTGRTPLQHIQIRVQRADNFYTPIGEVPNIRFLNMTRYVAGEEFTLGADTWKVFPWIKQGGTAPHSQQFAFAYKKVP